MCNIEYYYYGHGIHSNKCTKKFAISCAENWGIDVFVSNMKFLYLNVYPTEASWSRTCIYFDVICPASQ